MATVRKYMEKRSKAFYIYNMNRHMSTKFVDNNRSCGKEEMKAQFREAKISYMQDLKKVSNNSNR